MAKRIKAKLKRKRKGTWLVFYTERVEYSTYVKAYTRAAAKAAVRRAYKRSMGAELQTEFVQAKLVSVGSAEETDN